VIFWSGGLIVTLAEAVVDEVIDILLLSGRVVTVVAWPSWKSDVSEQLQPVML
jgi:hypothetical protein